MQNKTQINQQMTIQKLFIHEEQKSEKYVNYARFFLTILYLAAAFGIKKEIPEISFQVIIILSMVNMLYGIAIHMFIRSNDYVWWLKYISVSIDIILLSLFLYSIGTFRTFKTEAFLLYFIWTALTVLRFSPRLTMIAGLLSIFSYALISVIAINTDTIVLGTITEDFTTSKVSLSNIILRLLFLTFFVVIATYISSVYNALVTKSLQKILVDNHNKKLAMTLGELRFAQEELKAKNFELKAISETDMLSGLYNRRKTEEILHTLFKKGKNSLSLILMDIDNFKKINDSFGHHTGDLVIQEISSRLRENVRDIDYIGRWGGEEFLIICPKTARTEATLLAERLRENVPFVLKESQRKITGSYGVVQMQPGDSIKTLLLRVDQAMYSSKTAGRDRVTVL